MSDPVSGTSIIVAGGLMGAGMFGLVTGIDYGVVFGAFAGAVFYVATAVNTALHRPQGIKYFPGFDRRNRSRHLFPTVYAIIRR